MEILSLIYGLYPRSERLRKSLSRWERGMIGDKEIFSIIEEESQSYYKFCKSSGIRYCSDPLFNWYDILRPLALSMEGVSLGPLTRYKETNTFYRMPDIKDVLSLREIKEFRVLKDNPPLPLFHPAELDYLFFLPGVESFLKMSNVRGDMDKIKNSIINIYNKIIGIYSINAVAIYEPFPVSDFSFYDGIRNSVDIFLVTTGKIDESAFSKNSRKFFSIISDDPYSVSKYCKIPGIKLIDAFNTKIDTDKFDSMKKYKDDFGEIVVTSNEYLDFLPRAIADKKIQLMGGWGK